MSDETTLYRLDTKGKIRSWHIANLTYTLEISTGLLNGVKVYTEVDIVTNMSGRTQEEQAWIEYDSRIAKQLRLGYSNTIAEANKGRKFKGMKGKRLQDYPNSIPWKDACIEPKLNGMRIISTKENDKVELRTYGNVVNTVLKHIIAEQTRIQPNGTRRDGEVYKHGWTLQHIISSATNPKATDTHELQYHVFDDATDTIRSYGERRKGLIDEFAGFSSDITFLNPSKHVTSKEEAMILHKHYTSLGFEGIMIKNISKPYQYTKGVSILKYKVPINTEWPIVDVWTPETGTYQGCAWFVMKVPNGKTFKASHKGVNMSGRRKQYKERNSYIGRLATVKHFGLTEDGVPAGNPTVVVIGRDEIGDL